MSQKTYQLAISANLRSENKDITKQEVMSWLMGRGESTFVEGVVDDIELDPLQQGEAERYEILEGKGSPIFLYRYEQKPLKLMMKELGDAFGTSIDLELSEMNTSLWQEGWKESFRSFKAGQLWVCPPWESDDCEGSKVVIDPGMAFGTGQHATTKLCLMALQAEIDSHSGESLSELSLLDVGTGSGILAISASLLGVGKVEGTDIDSDAVLAATENARRNHCEIPFVQSGSLPIGRKFDLVLANILLPTLQDMLAELLELLTPQGVLVVSGITNEQITELLGVLPPSSTYQWDVSQIDDWAVISFRR